MSQGPGHVPLSDPADKREAQTGIWDCEGAYYNLSALFSHRGGAAGWTVRRNTDPMFAKKAKGNHSYNVMFLDLSRVRVDFITETNTLVSQSA